MIFQQRRFDRRQKAFCPPCLKVFYAIREPILTGPAEQNVWGKHGQERRAGLLLSAAASAG